MELKTLVNELELLESKLGEIKPVTNLAYHSRKVVPGTLFVCIKGYKTDGHLYLQQAVQKGAVAAVVEEIQNDVAIPQYRVNDSRRALAALADFFYDHPSHKLNLIGVTATNGKTTTTYMINKILEEHGLSTGLIGTVVVKNGKLVIPADLTTPESLDLHRYFYEMVNNGVTHAVMEVSSSGLELKRVGSVDFDIIVVNNISREHIDLHGSFNAYYQSKASLAYNARQGSWAVFNLDCPLTAALVNKTPAHTFTYSLKSDQGDCLVHDLDLSSGRARFTVELRKREPVALLAKQPRSFNIELSVLGLHSVYNAMAATMVGLLQGIPVQTIKKALKEFRGVERRFELIFSGEFKVIDDHFANSGNIHVTLETLQMMDYRKLHLVYAIRGSRGVTVNKENAEAIAYWAKNLNLDKIIATTSADYVGEKDQVTDEELAVFKSVMAKTGLKTEIFEKLPEAISRGLAGIGDNDVLLLAGCQGMDYGAAVCLQQLHQLKPHIPEEEIFAALNNRVAGKLINLP